MTRLVFVLDTPNVWRGRALAGTPARTLALAQHLRTEGMAVTLVLCDRGADYGSSTDWTVDVLLVHPEVFYDPRRLATELRSVACSALVCCEAEFLISTARPAATAADAHLVYDVHDDDAAVAATLDETASAVARHRRVQRAALRAADSVVVSTPGEYRLARNVGMDEQRIALAPNGADVRGQASRGPWPGSRLLVFVGNLYYEPNARAVRTIRDRVLPALQLFDAGVRVRVIGQGPLPLRRPQPGLEFTGRVPSLTGALAGAALGLAPLTAGSGAKMKVLDYLTAGIPVVGTSEAVTGLPAAHPGVVCDDIDSHAAVIAGLLASPDRLRELALAGVRCVDEELSWPAIAHRLAPWLERTISRTGARRAVKTAAGPGIPRWRTEHEHHGALGAPLYTCRDRPVWLRRAKAGVQR
jgi:glycosyltransferase involved in cell wall biosynthesis